MNSETPKIIGRREFLTLGTTALSAAALPWAPAFASSATANEAPKMAAPSPLVIGYWEGSEACESLSRISPEALAGWRLVPAESLRQGDVRFAGGDARIVIHGLFGRNGKPAALGCGLAGDSGAFRPVPLRSIPGLEVCKERGRGPFAHQRRRFVFHPGRPRGRGFRNGSGERRGRTARADSGSVQPRARSGRAVKTAPGRLFDRRRIAGLVRPKRRGLFRRPRENRGGALSS